jgi:YesN/AraC family two-component response regulator
MPFNSKNGLSDENIRQWMETQGDAEPFFRMQGRGTVTQLTVSDLQNSRIPYVSSFAEKNLLYTRTISVEYHAMSEYFVDRWDFENYLILYTLDGKGTLRYKDREYRLTNGDCFFIDCREPHYYATDSESIWLHHLLHLNGKDMPFYYNEYIKSGSAVVKIDDESNFDNRFQRIIRICNRYSNNEMIQHKLLTNLLVDLLLLTEDYRKNKVSDEVTEVCAYIDGHYSDNLSLEFLAHTVYQSKFHLSRAFKTELGVGINSYLNAVRINAAKELLVATNMSVAEISEAVGYSYPHYFINLFKKETGKTPKQFRQLMPQ